MTWMGRRAVDVAMEVFQNLTAFCAIELCRLIYGDGFLRADDGGGHQSRTAHAHNEVEPHAHAIR